MGQIYTFLFVGDLAAVRALARCMFLGKPARPHQLP